jgi:hypothetical protein
MPIDTVILSSAPASIGSVLVEESRLIWLRHKWELLGIAVLLFTFMVHPNWRLPDLGYMELTFREGWPTIWYFGVPHALVGLYLGLAIWRDIPPRERDYHLSMPVSSWSRQLIRIGLGGTGLAIMSLGMWYAGMAYLLSGGAVLKTPLALGFLPPVPWLAHHAAVLNAFLIASLVALRFDHPWRFILLYLPGAVFAVFALYLYAGLSFLKPLYSAILPPWGIAAATGINLWDQQGATLSPSIVAAFVWFGILLIATGFACRRRVEG